MKSESRNEEFFRLLAQSSWTVKKLAEQAGVSYRHLYEVLANKPGRGGQVRRKVAALLRPEELAALGWDANGNLQPKEAYAALQPG
ncbi:MAG: hypothetical protein HYY23_22265 [Verrucomicrobia bacterium]|nr:hypothetical protein [Verrucomicrobiota bacterium]